MIFLVDRNESIRLDVYLAAETGNTRSYVKTLIDSGRVLLNGSAVKAGKMLKEGDEISYDPPEPFVAAEPRDIPVDVIYEDDFLAVINKPQGMTVHPAPGNYDNTLVNALLFRFGKLSTINGVIRPGIVHRLDKNTSGVMVVAKNDFAHLSLSRQIAERTVIKKYMGITEGHLADEKGVVRTLIGRNPRDRKIMAVVDRDGREAITEYEVMERLDGCDLVSFHILTGRTHQIRVHAKYLRHPILGDAEYGSGNKGYAGQLLHSYSLTFVHPQTREEMTFTAPLPEYFSSALDKLRHKGN